MIPLCPASGHGQQSSVTHGTHLLDRGSCNVRKFKVEASSGNVGHKGELLNLSGCLLSDPRPTFTNVSATQPVNPAPNIFRPPLKADLASRRAPYKLSRYF
jgi:hypothetical protein